MEKLLAETIHWPTVLAILLGYGFLPRLTLRICLSVYPKDNPRRRELLAGLEYVPHWKRPLYVAEHLEIALVEGVPARYRKVSQRQWAIVLLVGADASLAVSVVGAWGHGVMSPVRWPFTILAIMEIVVFTVFTPLALKVIAVNASPPPGAAGGARGPASTLGTSA